MKLYTLMAVLILFIDQNYAATQKTIELEFCHVPNYSEEVLCGTFEVEENRAAPNGRKINLHIAVIPSVTEAKELDPLVLFAGGPGQGARDMTRFVGMAFRPVNENRDVVLIDQRGMGASNPLECEFPEEDFLNKTQEEMQAINIKAIQDCAANIDADVTLYTQDIANQDIYEALLAMGYDKINIYGGSWGTRSALLYANQYPDHVRTVVVDGVAPLANKVPLFATRDAQKAMDGLFEDCANDEQCSKTFGDLETRFTEFLSSIPEQGISATIADPSSGRLMDVEVTKMSVVNALRGILYSPSLSRMVPLIIDKMIDHDFRPLAGVVSAMGDAGMTIGATLTILCSEDFARMSEEDMLHQQTQGFVAGTFTQMFKESCDHWPLAPLPEIYKQELVQNVPTLILSGEFDPVTPPSWGDDMAKHFPNSLHIIAPNTGHNVAPVGCADDLIGEFITKASFEDIDYSCIDKIQRPSFFLNTSGPVGRTE